MFGVLSNDDHVGSATVLSFPSMSPARIAVTGRQKLNSYLAWYPPMYASAIAMLTSASKRAFSHKSRPRDSETIMAIRLQPNAEGSYQNRATDVWSAVLVVLFFSPIAFTSL